MSEKNRCSYCGGKMDLDDPGNTPDDFGMYECDGCRGIQHTGEKYRGFHGYAVLRESLQGKMFIGSLHKDRYCKFLVQRSAAKMGEIVGAEGAVAWELPRCEGCWEKESC